MTKKKIWIISGLAALLVLLVIGGVVFFGFARPYMQAESAMPEAMVQLQYQSDGSIALTWPAAENAHGYQVCVLQPSEGTQEDTAGTVPAAEMICSLVVADGNECVLEGIPLDRELEIRIDSYHDYSVFFSDVPRRRMGSRSLSVSGVFQPPAISDLTWEMNEASDALTAAFTLPENGICRVYHVLDGGTEQLDTLEEGSWTIRFGEDGSFPVPEYGQEYLFCFDVVCTYEDYTYTGISTDEIVVNREGLLGTDLKAEWTDEGNNVYSVTWQETKGAYYAIEQYDPAADEWVCIRQIQRGEELAYSTGHLPGYSDLTFRVVAVGGQTLPDSSYAAVSEGYSVSTGASVVYATIWPIQNLEVYADTAKTKSLGTAPAGEAYCILDTAEGMFYIRFGDGYGYIDSNYCMINLAEMMGDLCSYDITNSYSSIYKAHEYDLPTVTGEVITGYESIKQSGGGYLVPLLYPAALKLEAAVFAAQEEGYRLKIYDSYRPQKATRFLYDLATKVADDPVPGQEKTPAVTTPSGETVPVQELLTYRMVMTDNGRYTLSYFLAKGGSRHNQGIALDLTLEKLSSGKEIRMQTPMHDLSWYSENKENNANANKLRSIMLGAGFTGLVSEWWHFQDNDAKDDLNPAYLWDGVTAQCWMADDNGWRYRTASGKYVTDTVRTIDGVEYTFGADGYVTEPGEEEVNEASSDAE